MQTSRLDYANNPKGRQWTTRATFFAVIACLSIGVILKSWGPELAGHLEQQYWQHECLDYEPASGQVVYDFKGGAHFKPEPWQRFSQGTSVLGYFSMGTVFLHELRRPDGVRRLVAIDVVNLNQLTTRVFQLGTLFSSPDELHLFAQHQVRLEVPADGGIRIFAGRFDRGDASHFTFEVQEGSMLHVYDGWLENDDTVSISKRRAPTSAPRLRE